MRVGVREEDNEPPPKPSAHLACAMAPSSGVHASWSWEELGCESSDFRPRFAQREDVAMLMALAVA